MGEIAQNGLDSLTWLAQTCCVDVGGGRSLVTAEAQSSP